MNRSNGDRAAPKPPVHGFSMVAAKTILWCDTDTVSAVIPDMDGGTAAIGIIIPGRDLAWNVEISQPLFGMIRNAMERAEQMAEESRKETAAALRADSGRWWRPSVIAQRMGWKYF